MFLVTMAFAERPGVFDFRMSSCKGFGSLVRASGVLVLILEEGLTAPLPVLPTVELCIPAVLLVFG